MCKIPPNPVEKGRREVGRDDRQGQGLGVEGG